MLLVAVSSSLRIAAYFQYTWWVHGFLGGGNRRLIPSCVVTAIRERYPDEQYTGFREASVDDESFYPR